MRVVVEMQPPERKATSDTAGDITGVYFMKRGIIWEGNLYHTVERKRIGHRMFF